MISLLSLDQIEKRIKSFDDKEDLDYFKQFRGKEFYCQDYSDHWYQIDENEFKNKECCTNHMMGLPVKQGKMHPMYDFQEKLLELEDIYHNLIIKKSTGIGGSELYLRHKSHLALNDWDIGNVPIFTGPRIELAETLIERLKGLFKDHNFKSKSTIANIGKTRFEAYPSHHLATARGLTNVLSILLDEFDFFPPGQQLEAMSIIERYLAKGNPITDGISTPNLPGGLLEEQEKSDKNMVITFKVDNDYKNLELVYEREVDNPLYCFINIPYTIGMNRVYDSVEIQRAMLAPAFEREYNLKYGYGIGNIFQGIDEIIEDYDVSLKSGRKVLCVDPAYGSSKFGIIGMEKLDGIMYIKDATQYDRPSPSAMLDVVVSMAKRYDNNVLVDSAHPGLIRDLQEHNVSAHGVKFGSMIDGKEKEAPASLLSIMTIEAAQAVKEKRVRINKIFRELIAQLRAIQFNEKGHPDKKELTFDLGDAFLMGCNYFKTTHISVIKINK